MTEKYFTPSIEDIHVGYECEINPSPKLNPNNWVNHKIGSIKTFIHDDFYKIIEPYLHTGSLESYIRVPYLTREQVEKEGFSIMAKAKINENPYILEKNKHTIGYDFDNHTIILSFSPTYIYNVSDFKNITLSCKSINEFRKICKLLGI